MPPETTIVDASADFTASYETLPGSAYVYNIYTDSDLVTPAAIITETADTITTVTVQEILTIISNDLTVLPETAIVRKIYSYKVKMDSVKDIPKNNIRRKYARYAV